MQGTPNFSHPEHALHLYDPACKVCPPCRAISLFCKTLQELQQLNGRNGTYCGCGVFAQGSDASSGIASAVGCVAVQSLYHLLVGGSSHVLPLEGSSPCRCMMVSLGVATPFAGEGVLHGTHVVGCGLVVGCDVWEGRAPSPQLCGTRQKLYFHRFDLHSSSLQRPRPLLVSQNRHMRIPEVN